MADKILFFLTNDYTHYCLAHSLQKIHDCKMYAISEVTSRPKKFYQNQKDSKKIRIHTIYLLDSSAKL